MGFLHPFRAWNYPDGQPLSSRFAGCLNGGGQLRADGGAHKELLEDVERMYGSVRPQAPETNPAVAELYHQWLGGPDSGRARDALHTQYHAVEKNNSGFSIKW